MRSVFSRHALSMTWDFAEANVFSDSSGSFNNLFDKQVRGFEALGHGAIGTATQSDAATQLIRRIKSSPQILRITTTSAMRICQTSFMFGFVAPSGTSSPALFYGYCPEI